MEGKLLNGITIAGSDRACIARKASAGHAANLPFPLTQMRTTTRNVEACRCYGIDGASRETWLLDALIAWMLGKYLYLIIFKDVRKSQCTAIAVP